MKTLFLSAALMIFSLAQAQDFSFMATANKADVNAANEIAQNIASNAKTKYRLYKATENAQKANYRVIYAPAGLNDEQIKEQGHYDNCLIVDYTVFYEGKSTELERPGTKTYKLREVTAKYLDVFPSWQKYFNGNATAEQTVTDAKSQVVKDFDRKIDFRIQKSPTGNEWKIYNRS